MRKLLIVVALALPTTAYANPYNSGMRLLGEGKTTEAIRKFARSSQPAAAFEMGVLAEKGLVPNCDLNCALEWYRKAADGGYINAIPSIGALFWNDGKVELAWQIFETGARWNEPASRDWLQSNGRTVPEPDLWNAHVQRQQLAALEAQQRHAERDYQLGLALSAAANLWSSAQIGKAQGAAPMQSRREPLVGQSTSGWQRSCTYSTPGGNVQVVVPIGQSCPDSYGN